MLRLDAYRVYVDHRLRPESADEGEFVKEQAGAGYRGLGAK